MKIEDSPFQFNGASPLEKLRRNAAQASVDATLDELDLSFLELLNTMSVAEIAGVPSTPAGAPNKEGFAKESVKTPEVKGASSKVTTLQGKVSKTEEGEYNTAVDSDMVIGKDELSLLDIQYMKQEVIPALPILVGSVPFNSVFPPDSDGGISYKGFEISPKLAELIEKGYKTGRPIRVDLDANSAVVLKIRNGQVSAEFVSTDKGAVLVMQQELDDLRNRMAARQLPVGTLEYKYQDPRQSRQNKDEEPDEETEKR